MSREKDFIEAAERLAETKRTEDAKQQCLYDFGIAADYGYNYALQHPHWIPVEERLPEKENEFEDYSKLVVVTNGKDFWKGMYNYGGEDWRTFDLWLIDDATHWMEIVPPRRRGR